MTCPSLKSAPRRAITIALALFAFHAAIVASAADVVEDSARQGVRQLLTVGWQSGVDARRQVDDWYGQLKQQSGDPRVELAYAYALLKQHRFADASRQLDGYLRRHESDLQAWRAKIWVSMLMKEYPRALVEIDRLARLLPEAQADREAELENLLLAAFMGRMAGFLEGPAAGEVNDAALDERRRRIELQLTDTRRREFEEGRRRVLQQHETLTGEQSTVKDTAVDVAKEQQQRQRDEIDRRRRETNDQLAEMKGREENLLSDLDQKMADLDRQERPLSEQLRQLERQAVVAEREFLFVRNEILSIERALETERDPVLRDALLRELQRLELLQLRNQEVLAQVRLSGRQAEAQRDELARQRVLAQSQYQKQRERLTNEAADLRRSLKRLSVEEGRLGGEASGNTPRVRTLSRELKAFTTYEKFPLELEKQRLLESLK